METEVRICGGGTYLLHSPIQLILKRPHHILGSEIDILGDQGFGQGDANVEEFVVVRGARGACEEAGDADEVGGVCVCGRRGGWGGVFLVVFADVD